MKRLHVHVAVDDFLASKKFYSSLFAAEPTVLKSDYAKWMLDDPRVNFAISHRGATPGIEHLGIQVESSEELEEVYERFSNADRPTLEEGETTCCYAKSEKTWVSDPQGIAWEAFLTTAESETFGSETFGSETFGHDPGLASLAGGACCTPTTPQGECCVPKSELAADAPCCGSSSSSL
jgi:Glyoxalase/Bleomycin resistance protein/Dioxygenase superfamily